MAEGQVEAGASGAARSSVPARRFYTRILFTLVVSVGLFDLCLIGLGFADSSVLRHWGVAAGISVLGALAWELVVRSTGNNGVSPIAWVAFPISITLGIAVLPFLVLSVCPGLEGWFFRAEARYDEASRTIRISFPLAVEKGGINARVGAVSIDDSWARKSPQAFRWPSDRMLEIDAEAVLKDFALPRRPSTIDLNCVLDSPRFRYTTGDDVPAQTIDLK